MKYYLSFALLIAMAQAHSEVIVGQISKGLGDKILLKEAYSQEVYTIKMKGDYSKYLPSFLGKETYLKFTGNKTGSNFIGDRTPVIISGPSRVQGIFTISGKSMYIDKQEVNFTTVKKVNGFSFNKKSIKSYSNKEVIANGKIENGIFKISAIVPANLYSANSHENGFALTSLHSEFSQDPIQYVLKNVPKNENSQTETSFRETLIGEGREVKASDYALVITLSGRQGDDLGAANGHFAAGIAKVKKDLSLEMEVHNYYPPKNEKKIIPGAVDFVDYFGGLTAGQSNYRPTYTLIIYGESYERLVTMGHAMDEEFSKLRSGEDNFSVKHNCATVSNDGLAAIGIFGKNSKYFREALKPKNIIQAGKVRDVSNQFALTFGKTPSYYFPRPAFDSIIRNLKNLIQEKKLNAYRVDYVLQTQTPSDRPVGGTSADEFSESLKFSAESAIDSKKPFTMKKISEKLDKID
jgi:hypothetical protein